MDPTQDTSRTGTAKVTQDEEADTSKREVRNLEERNVAMKRKFQTMPNYSAEDLII